ncbi:MAG: TonB-dependent receptor domain-containing protein [Steroidobacteraceae bacterium]
MNHLDHHSDSRRSRWLVAPLLVMFALCAQAHGAALPQPAAQPTPVAQAQPATKHKPTAKEKRAALRLAQAQTVQNSKAPARHTELEEVVVTGSRIAHALNDTLQPTVEVSGAAFDERGYSNVSQALDELPEFGVPPTSQQNQQSAFSVGQSFVDLFSLGSQRTLTLVDGRRFVSSNTASLSGAASPGSQVDFNVIPVQLIDHIETVTVGGAPQYGADAIAGTVNVILKHDYQGFDVQAQSGVSNEGDAWNYKLSAIGGHNFADGRGNVTVVVEYNKSTGLRGASRSDYVDQGGFEAPATPGKYSEVWMTQGVVNQLSTSGVPYLDNFFYTPGVPDAGIGFVNSAGQPLAFSPGSNALSPYNLGTETGNPIFYNGGQGINLINYSNLQAWTGRLNADTLGHFDWTDHFQTFWEGWLSEDHSHSLISQPLYEATIFGNPGGVNGPLYISTTNPYLSAGDQQLIQSELNAYQAGGFALSGGSPFDPNWSNKYFYLDRGSTDLEAGAFTGDQLVARGVVGMKGDFSLMSQTYKWDTTMNYGYSRNISRQPAVVFQNLENAVNPVLNSSGQIVCPPGVVNSFIGTESETCSPLDIFGQGDPSAAARAYITHVATADSYNTQRDFTANITGPILKLPADYWQFALGFENRREAAVFEPDAFYSTVPAVGNFNATFIEGAYHTNEVYAETTVPVFEPHQDIPALYRVEMDGAIRRVNNSIAGNSDTWDAGMRWAPTQDILFRGNRTVSIRAPAITELFLPASTDNEFSTPDPCDKNFVTQGPDPATRAKNCAAAGINTATFTSNANNASVAGLTSGNTALASEVAKSYTYGFVLTPRWVPRLSIAADYISIKMSNAIEQLNLSDILEACYDAPSYPNVDECSAFTRNGQGQITDFHDGFVNAGLLTFQGDTITLNWQSTLPRNLGRVTWSGNYLDTKTMKLQVGGATPLNEAGELADTSNVLVPKDRLSVSANYVKGSFDWYWQAQFTSGMNFSNLNTPTSQDILTVNHWWLINSSIGYYLTDHINLRLVVDNVFNKEPPAFALSGAAANFTASTSYYFAGIIGRTYQLTVDVNLD